MPINVALTPEYGEPVWINANQIVSMQFCKYGDTGMTEIIMTGCAHPYRVMETPEEIHMIIEEEAANMARRTKR